MGTRLFERLTRYAASPKAISRSIGILLDGRTVRRSALFDRVWYLRENPELAREGGSPSLHYLAAGAPSGKDPGPGFCGAEYLALNPDVRAAGINPLVHYERAGRREGRRISFLQPVLADGRADPTWRFPSIAEHQAAFPGKIDAIRAKAAKGWRIRAVFMVATDAMFPARPLFDALRRNPRFDARIAVVPDMRGMGTDDPESGMELCQSVLSKAYPQEAFLPIRRDPEGEWPDVLSDFSADIVCHPSPYELSDFHYNPRWCVGRPFLPVYVNYGYPCTTFANPVFGLANYAYQWRVFLECEEALALYRSVSITSGANGEIAGSIKMDTLPRQAAVDNGGRRRILLAPHHSVKGGANDLLALSNFTRLSDFLADLPGMFPEMDFLFRPHPFLFTVLERPSIWGKAKCEAWRGRFLSHPNARWSSGGDPVDDFAQADAIIQDCASFLADWMFTGKPCCYVLHGLEDIGRKFNAIGKMCLEGCEIAIDSAAIKRFVENIRDGVDAKRDIRTRIRSRLAVNWPHAAEAAMAAIERTLL